MKGFITSRSARVALLAAALFVTAGALGAPAADSTAKKKGPAAPAKVSPVDVNSADAKTLETLPGIGSTLANRIVANRPYRNLGDLAKVKGLSQSRLDAIKDSITFGPATSATKETAKKETTAKSRETAIPQPSTASSSAPSKPTAAATAPTPTGSAVGKLAPGEMVNINTATAEQLDALPGIGPVKAQAIIEYREQHGPFKSIEEIENVKGIKGGTFSKIKEHIKVSD